MKNVVHQFAKFYLALLFGVLILSGIFLKDLGLEMNTAEILQGSSWTHPFGTDSLGRDLLRRIIQGGQVSVAIGILTTLIAFLIGSFYGAVAGSCEGWRDRLLMRTLDVFLSIPGFIFVSVLCIGFQNFLKFEDVAWRSFVSLLLAISFSHWMGLARVTRGLVMETKRLPYIEAAKSLGVPMWRIFFAHIFPNIRGRLVTLAAMQISTNIMYESFMSFIGLGMRAPWTSWGVLVQDGWKTLSSFPHLILFPAMAIFLTAWSLNVVVLKHEKLK